MQLDHFLGTKPYTECNKIVKMRPKSKATNGFVGVIQLYQFIKSLLLSSILPVISVVEEKDGTSSRKVAKEFSQLL